MGRRGFGFAEAGGGVGEGFCPLVDGGGRLFMLTAKWNAERREREREKGA